MGEHRSGSWLMVPVVAVACDNAAGPVVVPCEPVQDHTVEVDPPPSWDTAAPLRDDCQFHVGSPTSESLPGAPAIPDAVKHVIVVLRENRSFDHYLGAYVPATGHSDVAPADAWNPDPSLDPPGSPVMRYHETRYCLRSTTHEWSSTHLQFNNGALDGFVSSNNDSPERDGERSMGYYTEDDIPFYYWLARNFAISDRYFASILGPTHPNLMHYWRATSCGYAENLSTNPNLTLNCGLLSPSIFTRLDDARTSDPSATYGVYSDANPPAGTASLVLGPYLPHAAKSIAAFEADVASDSLPAVVFVEPNYGYSFGTQSDEHPPTNMQIGQRLTYRVIAAVMSNPAVWNSTIMFLTWDENGGYYDHVVPPKACAPEPRPDFDFQFTRYGFRVPFIAVSPYAREGYVSHYVGDHTSILRFIEHWKHLGALSDRDANAWPLLDMFDFSAARTVPMPDPGLAAESTDPVHVASCTGGA